MTYTQEDIKDVDVTFGWDTDDDGEMVMLAKCVVIYEKDGVVYKYVRLAIVETTKFQKDKI